MNYILKTSVALMIIFVSCHINGQSFAVKGGVNFAKFNQTYNDKISNGQIKSRVAYHIGVSKEIKISENFYIEPGLNYTSKGTNGYYQGFEDFNNSTLALNYIEIPVNLKLTSEIRQDVILYGALGPYVAYGLNGYLRNNTTNMGEKENIEWGEDDDLQRLDTGLTFGLGIEYKSIILGLSYDLGLLGIAGSVDDEESVTNRVLKVSTGYKF